MTLHAPVVGELKRMRARAGDVQVTFEVPPHRAADFARALLADGAGAEEARLLIDAAVFAPHHLHSALHHAGGEAPLEREAVIEAGPGEAVPLLTAALSDWTDFWFAPKPGAFLLYGDHDEYSTIFAHKQGAATRVVEALRSAGFREVAGYVRRL